VSDEFDHEADAWDQALFHPDYVNEYNPKHDRKIMSTLKGSGKIEAVARSQKAFKLEGSEDWYSVFKPVQMNGAEAGSTVSFEYEEKPKGGEIHRNVKGNLEITSAAPRTATPNGGFSNTKDVNLNPPSPLQTAGDPFAAAGVPAPSFVGGDVFCLGGGSEGDTV